MCFCWLIYKIVKKCTVHILKGNKITVHYFHKFHLWTLGFVFPNNKLFYHFLSSLLTTKYLPDSPSPQNHPQVKTPDKQYVTCTPSHLTQSVTTLSYLIGRRAALISVAIPTSVTRICAVFFNSSCKYICREPNRVTAASFLILSNSPFMYNPITCCYVVRDSDFVGR